LFALEPQGLECHLVLPSKQLLAVWKDIID
jgi:hypothetical protein